MVTPRILQAPPRTELLRPGEAARALGADINTLRRWERDGKLAVAVRMPSGHRRYRYTSIEQTARHLGIPWAVR